MIWKKCLTLSETGFFFFLREIMNQLHESIPIELLKKPMEYLQSEIILNGKCLNLLETDSDFR